MCFKPRRVRNCDFGVLKWITYSNLSAICIHIQKDNSHFNYVIHDRIDFQALIICHLANLICSAGGLSKGLYRIVMTFIKSLPQLANILILMSLILVIFALFGMQVPRFLSILLSVTLCGCSRHPEKWTAFAIFRFCSRLALLACSLRMSATTRWAEAFMRATILITIVESLSKNHFIHCFFHYWSFPIVKIAFSVQNSDCDCKVCILQQGPSWGAWRQKVE